jgi:hypothetical protein
MTPGLKLIAKVVIHAGGPKGSDRQDLLASSFSQALKALTRHGLRTIAFQCISTGVYGFDLALSADIAMRTVKEWIERSANWSSVDRVVFVMHTDEEEAIYPDRWETSFPTRRAPVHVRLVTATTPTPATAFAVDLDTRRPSITCGRPGCASPPKALDIRPGERPDRHLHQH